MARPSVISQNQVSSLRRAFLWGATDEEACVYANVSTSAFYRYQAKNKEFREQKEVWKSNPVLLAKRVVVEKIKEGDEKTAKWYLERKARSEFSIRKEVVSQESESISKTLDKLEHGTVVQTDYEKLADYAKKTLEGQNVAT